MVHCIIKFPQSIIKSLLDILMKRSHLIFRSLHLGKGCFVFLPFSSLFPFISLLLICLLYLFPFSLFFSLHIANVPFFGILSSLPSQYPARCCRRPQETDTEAQCRESPVPWASALTSTNFVWPFLLSPFLFCIFIFYPIPRVCQSY